MNDEVRSLLQKVKDFKSNNVDQIAHIEYAIIDGLTLMFYAGYVTSFKKEIKKADNGTDMQYVIYAPSQEEVDNYIYHPELLKLLKEQLITNVFEELTNEYDIPENYILEYFNITTRDNISNVVEYLDFIFDDKFEVSILKMISPLITKRLSEIGVITSESDEISMFEYLMPDYEYGDDYEQFFPDMIKYLTHHIALLLIGKSKVSHNDKIHKTIYQLTDESVNDLPTNHVKFYSIINNHVGITAVHATISMMKFPFWKMMSYLTSTKISYNDGTIKTSPFNEAFITSFSIDQ